METPRGEPRETNRVLSFLERYSLWLAIGLIAIASVRIASTYTLMGITYDEPAHIACGMQFLSQHTYQYEAQHPPLSRAMCALGPYLAGLHPQSKDEMTDEGVSILYEDGDVGRNLFLDRIGILPFFIAASLVVYWWGKRYFGGAVGVLATALFTWTPSVLAHAGLGTTDMAATAGLGVAFLALLTWVAAPTLNRGLWLGAAVGFALLCKFSLLVFLPASAACALSFYVLTERPSWRKLYTCVRERAASFGAATLITCIVVHAGYLFSFGQVIGSSVWLPAPEFFQGIREVMDHNSVGHPSFFLGQISWKGWWYYFPVMLFFKTPLGLFLLIGLGLFLCWRYRGRMAYGLPIALVAGVLLPSMAAHINIGTRHVLPAYLGLSLIGALGLEYLLRSRIMARLAAAALVAWLLIAVALHHPDYLSYHNEFVRRPEDLFIDSDYDWGQGTPLLARHLKEHGTSDVTCSFWYLTSEQLRTWPGINVRKIDFTRPAEGWTAVSPTYWRLIGVFVNKDEGIRTPWFAGREPDKRLGGMLLYYVAPK